MIKVFEMFSGFGGASWGLKKAGIEFECVGHSEIDKYAIHCFEQNFPNIKNFGDCTKINTNDLPDFDLLTGGFPCQDVSIAGKRDLNKGRTNLYSEIIRIASAKKPKYLLLENVKGLLSMEVDERKLVNKIVSDLQKIGYGVCWKVLNSKDFGIPQNRERIWFVCKLGGWEFMEFQFPEKQELKLLLKDLLEENPDKKYFLTEKQMNSLFDGIANERRSKQGVLQEDVCGALAARDYKTPKCVELEGFGIMKMIDNKKRITAKNDGTAFALGLGGRNCGSNQIIRVDEQKGRDREFKRIYSPEGIAPTLHLKTGGWQEPKIIVPRRIRDTQKSESFITSWALNLFGETSQKEKEVLECWRFNHRKAKYGKLSVGNGMSLKDLQEYFSWDIKEIIQSILSKGYLLLKEDNKFYVNSCRKIAGKFGADFISSPEGWTPTIMANSSINAVMEKKIIRKLTPRECFRLMGFLNDEINLQGLSDTRVYHLAGNGWDVNLVSKIFKRMFHNHPKN